MLGPKSLTHQMVEGLYRRFFKLTSKQTERHLTLKFQRSRALMIRTSPKGRSPASVCTLPNRLITSIPLLTRPKMVCLPSRCGVGASVMKNWGLNR